MSGIRTFIKKMILNREIPHVESHELDIERLDASLDLLKMTTLEVSEAAVCAAKVLGSRLNDSIHRFYSTIDAVDDLIQTKDDQGRWTAINTYGQNLFGFFNREYVGKSSDELALEVSDLQEWFEKDYETDEIAWKTKKPYRFEAQIPYVDDYEYFDFIKTPIFDKDGYRKEMITIARNITATKEKDRRTKACFFALNSASDPIIILDSFGRIHFANDEFLRRFGFENYCQVLDKFLTDIIPDFTDYPSVWDIVKSNHPWCGNLNEWHMNILPVMNSVSYPIYYICTIKPINNCKEV